MTLLVRTTRLVFIVLIGSNVSINAQTATPAPQKDSIDVSLAMEKEHVPIGQSPWAILTVDSLTPREVVIPGDTYRVYVEGKNGEPPTTLAQRQWTGRLQAWDEKLRGDEFAIWTICCGQSGFRKIQLGDLYYLSTPGEYAVYAEVMDPWSHKWLRTNTVTFEMQAISLWQLSSTTTLTILVQNPSGAPIPGASVIVQHWADTSDHRGLRAIQDAVATIGDQGYLTFPLPPRSYDVFVSGASFVPTAAEVPVYEGRENRKVFNLKLQTDNGVEAKP